MNNKCMPEVPCDGKCTSAYAQAFVIRQREGEDMFEPMEALTAGTIYPALYMPYKFWRFKNER